MSGRRILSDEQLDTMAELRERGWSFLRISEWFTARGTAISQGSVAWQCLRLGVDSPKSAASNYRGPNAGRTYQRHGKAVRAFTPDEDARLLALEAQGMPLNQIAVQIGRAGNSVRGRLYTLARYSARAEADGR